MVLTYKNKFNKKFGFEKNEPHSIDEIAKITGYKKPGLKVIFEKAVGAWFSNPQSIRPNVVSKEQWGMGRIYSAVMGGKAARIDKNQLTKR